MKEMTDRLAARGANISPDDQVVTLLESLPDSYSTALEVRADENVYISIVQQALLNEELKQN